MKKDSANNHALDVSACYNMLLAIEEYEFLLKVASFSRYDSAYDGESTIEINEALDEIEYD